MSHGWGQRGPWDMVKVLSTGSDIAAAQGINFQGTEWRLMKPHLTKCFMSWTKTRNLPLTHAPVLPCWAGSHIPSSSF